MINTERAILRAAKGKPPKRVGPPGLFPLGATRISAQLSPSGVALLYILTLVTVLDGAVVFFCFPMQ